MKSLYCYKVTAKVKINNRQTDRQIGQKQYVPDLSMQGHKIYHLESDNAHILKVSIITIFKQPAYLCWSTSTSDAASNGLTSVGSSPRPWKRADNSPETSSHMSSSCSGVYWFSVGAGAETEVELHSDICIGCVIIRRITYSKVSAWSTKFGWQGIYYTRVVRRQRRSPGGNHH